MDYKYFKRVFDLSVSLIMLLVLFPLLLILTIIAAIDTSSNGLFLQERVGQFGRLFNIYKLRTYHKSTHNISPVGAFLRRFKLDELPQLLNVLLGTMSFVGPRPDLPGYYDRLEGEDRLILNLKPGITCEASIKYKDEEYLLSKQADPEKYNNEVIFPDKVKINLNYYYGKNLREDMHIMFKTLSKIK